MTADGNGNGNGNGNANVNADDGVGRCVSADGCVSRGAGGGSVVHCVSAGGCLSSDVLRARASEIDSHHCCVRGSRAN